MSGGAAGAGDREYCSIASPRPALLSSRLSAAWCRAGRPHGFGGFTPPSKLPFNTLHNVILAPNDCEKSDVYWNESARGVASNLDDLAAGRPIAACDGHH